jgi:thioredoxin reductase (NADPH)
MSVRDILVVGAGPAGLATAIAAKQANLDCLVIEKGALVNSLQHFPVNMVFFTSPELLEIGGLPFVTPHEKPTRFEALNYYRRVVDTFDLEIAFDEEVLAVYPDQVGSKPEQGLTAETRSTRGVRRVLHGRTLVLGTGCYDRPNLIGVPGEDLPHVSHYYTEAHGFYRKRVVVVGGKNSAAETALDLFRSGVSVTLVHRRSRLADTIKYWVKPDIENRIKEGSIAARFDTRVVEIRPTSVVLESADGRDEIPADAVFLLTGYVADTELLSQAGVRFDDRSFVPEYDRTTFETNVPGLFVVGSVVSGRQRGEVFIENGRFHGQQVVSVICERLAGVAAR